MSPSEIIYLGPAGTYSHEVARQRYRNTRKLRGCESIQEICRELAGNPHLRGIVPIVNSSGGMIYETVDELLDTSLSLGIEEELAMNVHLALLGRKGEEIRAVYSHFAPLKHCGNWLRKKYPRAEWVEVASTAIAAREAAAAPNAAAVCNKKAARIYGLDVLRYPVPGLAEKNVTHFVVIGRKCKILPHSDKTSLAIQLPNKPGSLFDFLKPLAEAKLNLSSLISRPIPGRPKEFAFFMDIDASLRDPLLKQTLKKLKCYSTEMRIVGSYPSSRLYTAS